MRRAILNGQWLNGYVVNSNLPIGAPMAWLSEVPPVGFLAFDGSEYNISDYPELYNVVKNIPSFHSDTEGKFKIPNLKGRVLQGADTVIGELIEAGLPNIEGRFRHTTTGGSGSEVDGAFSNFTISGVQANVGGQYTGNGVKFDASKSNAIYGNSDTVQMDAFTVYWVIKATQYSTVEQNAIDDTRFTTGNVLSAAKVVEMNSYSTDEKVIGKWIDGKNIYRNVLSIPKKDYMRWQFIEATDNLNIDKVLNAVMYGTDSEGYTDCMGHAYARRYPNNKLAFIVVTYALLGETLVLEYTKTTD